jgi:hypothetical protein
MKRIALLVVVIAACGKSDKTVESKVASCYMESMHGCVEYRDANLALGTESLKKLCTAVINTAVFAETPCPTSNVIATCKRNEGKDFFYAGSEQRDVLEKQCTERGGKYGQ